MRLVWFYDLDNNYLDKWPYEPAIVKRGNLLWLGDSEKLYRISRIEHHKTRTECFVVESD